MSMALSTPDTRQDVLRRRLMAGQTLAAADLAAEFGVSGDTIRRDLLALEAAGVARRTRGGVMPVMPPVVPMAVRAATTPPGLVVAAARLVLDGMAVAIDGGTTMLALAQAMVSGPRLLVVTPSPAVALCCLDKGIATQLVGGRLSAAGGIAVGAAAERAIAATAVDLCFLGVCGLDAAFGLSADDPDEAGVKAAMAAVAARTVAVAGADKIGRRARHRAIATEALDSLFTDAPAAATDAIAAAGVRVHHG
jgi:DeoR/GlpR family transcriptional regulator of sugar metabolism